MKQRLSVLFPLLLILTILWGGCQPLENLEASQVSQAAEVATSEEIPAFSGSPYVELEENQPDFTSEEYTTTSFEEYSPLDDLGRCGPAVACVGVDLMPTEDRENISQVHPTGWVQAEYPFVDGGSLYNRCHLIGFQLTGENANEDNLITGTRYMNVEGMLPFENMVADYVKETENHVLYRVTPVFQGDELVARGVVMEALSMEDEGEGICFHVYVYNNQPGVTIDYDTGESWESGEDPSTQGGSSQSTTSSAQEEEYVLNTNSHKFHRPDCPSVGDMKEENRQEYHGTRQALLEQGYEPCGNCNP